MSRCGRLREAVLVECPPLVHIAQQLEVHVPQEGPVAPLLQIADGPVVLIADDRARRLRGEGRAGAVSWRCLHASRRSERDAAPASRRPCAGRTLRWPRCPAPLRVHGDGRGRLSEATFATSRRETLPPPGQPGGREAPFGTGARTSCDVPCVRPPQLPCLHRLGRRTPWCLPHGADRAKAKDMPRGWRWQSRKNGDKRSCGGARHLVGLAVARDCALRRRLDPLDGA